MLMAAIVRELIAAGVTGDALVTAINNIEESAKPARSSAAVRQARYRERNKTITRYVTGVTGDAEASPLDAPLSLSPHPLPLPPLNPPTTKKLAGARKQKPRVSLEELSVDHISEWLARKRGEGKYLQHDEHFILEFFKSQCQAKGYEYDDYTAAYRNAFEWERCQPKAGAAPQIGGNPRGSEKQRTVAAYAEIIAERTAKANQGMLGEPEPTERTAGKMLSATEGLW